MKSINIPIQPPGEIAQTFVERSIAGYTKNLAYSCGYALLVEIEADYQIALLAKFTDSIYGSGNYNTTYFEVHMNETGEEEHARRTILLAESLVKNDKDYEQFLQGFNQSLQDTKDFVESIYKNLPRKIKSI